MKLLVGLGNPGANYVRHPAQHRVRTGRSAGRPVGMDHQAGKVRSAVADELRRTGPGWDGQQRLSGGDEKVLLLKPLTFMNLSGKSVQAAMSFYQLVPTDLMVVLDDLALPCGKIRIRAGGSSGGHNGLKDIQRVLGTDQYPRLRIGIDPTPARVPGKGLCAREIHHRAEGKRLDPALDRAAGAVVTWVDKGIVSAMSQFNGEEGQ